MGLITGQFNEAFIPIMDGVTNVVRNYALWLNRKYGVSYVITPHYPDYEDKEEFEVIRYHSFGVPTRPPYRTGLPVLDVQFMHRIKNIPFDIVHAHSPFSAGRIAMHIARKRGIPIVASFHSKYYDDLLEALKLQGAAKIGVSVIMDFYNSADFVWTVNKSTAGTLREYGYKGNIEVINNGTEFDTPADRRSEGLVINKILNLRPDETVFLYAGQLVWQKNLKTLLNALAILKKMGMGYRMLIAGMGYAESELKKMAEELDLTDRVIFLGPVYDRQYMRCLYCRADLLLFPSLYDNASIVLQEAASQKCPALLVQGSNTAEGVIDGLNGLLAENSPESIAKKIFDSVRTCDLSKIGENAHETLYRKWESIVDEVYGRYREIVSAYKRIRA
mgnify:CR=1 FL=1|jgi:Glycosyl transferases group 1.